VELIGNVNVVWFVWFMGFLDLTTFSDGQAVENRFVLADEFA
jgi:hypothetical protein